MKCLCLYSRFCLCECGKVDSIKVIAEDNDIKGVKTTETSFLSCRAEQNGMGITRSLPETEPCGFRGLRTGLVSKQGFIILLEVGHRVLHCIYSVRSSNPTQRS